MDQRICEVAECGGAFKGLGYCGKHYQRFVKYGSPDLPERPRTRCGGPECVRTLDPIQAKSGLCRSHYKQQHLGKQLTPLLVATKDLGRPPVCVYPGCDRPHKARGYCKGHRDHIKAGHEPNDLADRLPPGPCSLDGCERSRFVNGLCFGHNSNLVQRWRMYGLTPAQGEVMYEHQGRACAACSDAQPLSLLHIDHDHSCCLRGSCGECVRGLLCRRCNLAAGHSADSPARLRALADYLERAMPD